LKALSGVARAKGKFGKTLVAQMLVGSKSEKVTCWKLDELSTFGLLAAFKQPEVMQLLDALTRIGLTEAIDVDSFRPIIALSDAGRDFLREPTSVALELPVDLAAKVRLGGVTRSAPRAAVGAAESAEPSAAVDDEPLRERLRSIRKALSTAEGRPAYSIFPDETLTALVRERPRTPQDLARIKGMGPSRLERYGQAILEAIAGTPAKTTTPDRVATAPVEVPRPPRASDRDYVPTEEWTIRLLERGFSAHEAAAIRGLDVLAIYRHASLAARGGRAVEPGWLIDDETLARWRAWRSQHGDRAIPPSEAAADLWSFFVACET
jgi:ATP-dependent DNA helicase RecQ